MQRSESPRSSSSDENIAGGQVTPPERNATPPLSSIRRGCATRMPTQHGDFRAICYADLSAGVEHLVLVAGDLRAAASPLVRVHSECATGDIFGSRRCDCGPQLQRGLREIAAAGCGALVYLRGHEGRGIGLGAKLEAYALQDAGRDTLDANLDLGHPVDARSYDAAAAMLLDLGVASVRLMTNNPDKCDALEELGVRVSERVPCVVEADPENARYLRTKQERMGHLLGLPDL